MTLPAAWRQTAERLWSADRLQRVLAWKKTMPLHPVDDGALLVTLGMMNADASMRGDQVKKFSQICHLLQFVTPALHALAKSMPGQTLHLLDAGCGNSYLTLTLAHLHHQWRTTGQTRVRDWIGSDFTLHLHGIDSRADVIATSQRHAQSLGLASDLSFAVGHISEAALPPRLHGVIALHACDTATDEALALAVKNHADWIAVAPCCQAELAHFFQKTNTTLPLNSPLSLLVKSPHLRREAAATLTDTLRLGLLRSLGYEVTATEFIPSSHTPKNRLINAIRRGRYQKSAYTEWAALHHLLGQPSLALTRHLQSQLDQFFPSAL